MCRQVLGNLIRLIVISTPYGSCHLQMRNLRHREVNFPQITPLLNNTDGLQISRLVPSSCFSLLQALLLTKPEALLKGVNVCEASGTRAWQVISTQGVSGLPQYRGRREAPSLISSKQGSDPFRGSSCGVHLQEAPGSRPHGRCQAQPPQSSRWVS